jgi:dGTPase
MRDHGGFEHNCHALRIVEVLEYRYPNFPGLNLSWEVREAMALHSKRREQPEVAAFTGVGQPLLEAQVADAADSLAYDAHDVDDALSVGLITPDDLRDVPFWREVLARVKQRYPNLDAQQFQPTVVRGLIDMQVTDLLEHTVKRLRERQVQSVEDVRICPDLLIAPGPGVAELKANLEQFLHQRVYQHYRVQRMAAKGRRIVQELFKTFCHSPKLLPERYGQRIRDNRPERTVCDYLAGMTDRYAQDEHVRLFQPYAPV